MISTSILLWGVLFSSIGLAYFIYGKKQRKPVPLFCGLALMVYPYAIDTELLLVLIGVVLCAIPYYWRI
jgi:hypothetical protein